MALVKMFKMPFATTHFNTNQRVFIVYGTGDLAAYCTGKFRGKGRYVKAWVKWASQAKSKTPPIAKDIEVADDFAERHGLSDHAATSNTTSDPCCLETSR